MDRSDRSTVLNARITQTEFARAAGLGALLFAIASQERGTEVDSLVQMLHSYTTRCSADARERRRLQPHRSIQGHDANTLRR